jgi:hypothetical protein
VAERSLTGHRVLVAGGALGGLGGVISNADWASKGRMVEAQAACLTPPAWPRLLHFCRLWEAGTSTTSGLRSPEVPSDDRAAG